MKTLITTLTNYQIHTTQGKITIKIKPKTEIKRGEDIYLQCIQQGCGKGGGRGMGGPCGGPRGGGCGGC